ncbi:MULTISPECIES: hypothetical protein [Cytobacillus]|uniref:Uncharacterized protein n=1 Tax=Cytobacillus stercorigallinarum TaxID=2762240 RepID=A0ABR8QVY7_9BACI|nr:hypothetical protein [Cytobacillus stercorigallinarum]MBD7939614.1 hypothetical protein [Cytobacillus stercorigallinarum]
MPIWLLIAFSILVGLIIIEEVLYYVVNRSLLYKTRENDEKAIRSKRWSHLKEKYIKFRAKKTGVE